jgi:hypothetical protein
VSRRGGEKGKTAGEEGEREVCMGRAEEDLVTDSRQVSSVDPYLRFGSERRSQDPISPDIGLARPSQWPHVRDDFGKRTRTSQSTFVPLSTARRLYLQ